MNVPRWWQKVSLQRAIPEKSATRVLVCTLVFTLTITLTVLTCLGQSQESKDKDKDSKDKDSNTQESRDAVSTIAVNVNVVTLPVTVRDKHGQLVKDLTKDDFTLQDRRASANHQVFFPGIESAAHARPAGRYQFESARGSRPGAQREPQLSRSDAGAAKGQGISHPFRSRS